MKKYKFGFDLKGALLFAIIMLPNIFWVSVPAQNDLLRIKTSTPLLDAVVSVLQIIMIAAICLIKNSRARKPMNPAVISAFVILYFAGWGLYYAGVVNAAVILILCIAPGAALASFAVARKNAAALTAAVLFTVLHTISGILNFL